MNGFSQVVLLGNLTRDFERRQVGEYSVAESALAINEKRGDRESVAFVDVEIWGKGGEIASTYARKGSPLLVEGRLKYDSWNDKTTGQKRTSFSVVVDNFRFVGGKPDESKRPVVQNNVSSDSNVGPNDIPF